MFTTNITLHFPVAPFTGAWIETDIDGTVVSTLGGSLPSRERGLKLGIVTGRPAIRTSLPSRERGLKHYLGIEVDEELSRSLHGSVD